MISKHCLLIILLLVGASNISAEDTRWYQRPDTTGYDFFDFSGRLVGQSFKNSKGSYDFRDNVGTLVGWAETSGSGKIIFHRATGEVFRVIERFADGSGIIYDAEGKIMNYTTPTYVGGGTQNYDAQGYATSFGLYSEHVTIPTPNSP